jgi:hypothetical protein
MTKQVLIDTIGRVFVDNDFRNEFNGNPERAISGISDLSDKEREFLKEMSTKIGECTAGLDLTYEGENKTRR